MSAIILLNKVVLATIQLALQSYLGSETTIKVISVPTEDCGPMDATARVIPDKTGTEQTHHEEAEHICHLVACIDKDSSNIRFLVFWVIVDIEEKWFLGYLFLRDVGTEEDWIHEV